MSESREKITHKTRKVLVGKSQKVDFIETKSRKSRYQSNCCCYVSELRAFNGAHVERTTRELIKDRIKWSSSFILFLINYQNKISINDMS